MPHIHPLFDFVVSVFIVYRGKVLLIHHKSYDEWLPIGGHIELNEDPEQALYREIQEECGLDCTVLAKKPPIAHPGVKPLLTPEYLDVHRAQKNHKHIAFVYFATSQTDQVRLHEREHSRYKWFSLKELSVPEYAISPSIKFYGRRALIKARTRKNARKL